MRLIEIIDSIGFVDVSVREAVADTEPAHGEHLIEALPQRCGRVRMRAFEAASEIARESAARLLIRVAYGHGKLAIHPQA